jgi:hypothetical protein
VTSAADARDAIPELLACDCNALEARPLGEVAPLSADDGERTTKYRSDRYARSRRCSQAWKARLRSAGTTSAISAATLAGIRGIARSNLGVRGSERGLMAVIGGTSTDMPVKRQWVSQFSRTQLMLDIAGDVLKPSSDFPSSPVRTSVRNHANANA